MHVLLSKLLIKQKFDYEASLWIIHTRTSHGRPS